MKVSLLLLVGVLLIATMGFSQTGDANLLLQSPDGKTVKLVWFLKSWNKEISGFDIKRKEGQQGWVKLNTEAIIPEISAKKKLSNVEADKNEESVTKARVLKMIARKKLKEIDNTAMISGFLADDKVLQDFSILIASNYDVALASGFGFVDRSAKNKTGYCYGLFAQGTNVLLDSAMWNYGEIPDLNVVKEITSRGTKATRGITVFWTADVNKLKAGDIAGFNVYREGMRLNQAPIVAGNVQAPSEFNWTDKSANAAETIQYSISAESLLGIEGIIKSYKYDPEEHPSDYKLASITGVKSLGYYFKEGIDIKWNFPVADERFIKGFYIEKSNLPDGFQQIAPLIEPFTREYIDKSPSPISGYIKFRVKTLYLDKTVSVGPERLYYYFPQNIPPKPDNFRVKLIPGDKKYTVQLSWNPKLAGDSVTDYYRVYVSNQNSGKLLFAAEKTQVRTSKYNYEITHGSATVYKFIIAALGKKNMESPLSDTIAISVPSLELPQPLISKVLLDSGKAVVQWQYPDVADVKGFKLYQNTVEIANEGAIKKGAIEFVTTKLEPNTAYTYTLRAISENGVMSEYSLPVAIQTPLQGRKSKSE